jgi:hypothetical protein
MACNMRGRILAAAVVLVFSACGSAVPRYGITYASYTYNCCAEIAAGVLTWHAGQHVTLHWQAQAGPPTSDNTPHYLALRVWLTGPFPSVDALKHAISTGNLPSNVRTIDATSPSVSDRTGGVPASELDLPADLPRGYYNVDSTVASAGGSSSGGAIVTIQ